MMTSLFKNRFQAAHELAEHLAFLRAEDPVVLGLANGGVPVADIVARELNAAFDVLLIQKLYSSKVPGQVVGAVDEHGRISVIQASHRWHHLAQDDLAEPARIAFGDVQRRHAAIRTIMPEIDVAGRVVIVVDDGVATGAKMLAATAAVKDRNASKIVVAAPAGSSQGSWQIHAASDHVVIPRRPAKFKDVASLYEDFQPVTDEMVLTIIRAWLDDHESADPDIKSIIMKLRSSRGHLLMCEVDLPPDLTRAHIYPAVIFAHGAESHGRSARNVAISRCLAKHGIIGVRMDFTGHGRSEGSVDEATDAQMIADLRAVFTGIAHLKEVNPARIGVVGSGAGCMAALELASEEERVAALVLRGPVCNRRMIDAAHVQAPTLLIHADADTALVESVETLDRAIPARHKLVRIPNSNRLFQDPRCLDEMVNATVEWLVNELQGPQPRPAAVSTPVASAPG